MRFRIMNKHDERSIMSFIGTLEQLKHSAFKATTVKAISIFIVVISGVFAPASAGGNTSRHLSPMDVFDVEFALDPQISPNGKSVVYTRQYSDVMTDQNLSNLWFVNLEDGTSYQLTDGAFNERSPIWSPDGSQIAFISNRDGRTQIYVISPSQDAKPEQVTQLMLPPLKIAWSPDGKSLAYSAPVPVAPRTIGNVPKPPQGAKWSPQAKIVDRSMFRMDGVGATWQFWVHLYVTPVEGGQPTQVSSGNLNHTDPFVWTPDSKALVTSVNLDPENVFELLDTNIVAYSVEDKSVKQLTNRVGPDNAPVISPDGKHIAYIGYDDRHQAHQTTKLYIMDIDGNHKRVVTKNLDRSILTPKWHPNGQGILAMYIDEGTTKLSHFDLNGTETNITNDIGSYVSAYSSAASFSISEAGRVAVTYTRPDLPNEIAVGSVAEPFKTVTSINEDFSAKFDFGTVEEIWYTSSVGQLPIQGWIVKPPHFDSSKKYPLILEIHGGPITSYGRRFDIEKQIMAARGYVTLYTNPRGSTGYGEDFGNLLHQDYPGYDADDIRSGVAAVVKRGYIDTDNMFITGGSGGGTLTGWITAQTDEFRAAAMLFPVTNWFTTALASDVWPFVITYMMGHTPWDAPEHYIEKSPISKAGSVKTPTLILTGEADLRSTISESEQYYAALKWHGVETVLISVPGEPHAIRRKPSHFMTRLEHVIGWFDEHRTKAQK